MKYNQKLPAKVEESLDAYIERIKGIKWFQPSLDLKKSEVEKQASVVLKAFGVEATFEYRQLKTAGDWDAARDAAWCAAWDAAWGEAWGAARDAAWDAAWGAAWDAAWCAARDAAWCAAWDAAWGAADVLTLNLKEYKKKYPKGSFVNLVPLWEMGLYPVGVIDGKFVIYVPSVELKFPKELK